MTQSNLHTLPPTDPSVEAIHVGAYSGWIAAEFSQNQEVREWLSGYPPDSASAVVLKEGRHRVLRLQHANHDVVVKAFGQQSGWKDQVDQRRGSKAKRSFLAACHLLRHGLGTPRPVACLERWQGTRLEESFFISLHEDNLSSFRRELIHLYNHEPICELVMNLMQSVATAIARLHEAGALHGDLGNQNIMLRRHGPSAWGDVMFIDLNRMRFAPTLSLDQRARDLSRIHLPSDFLRVFKAMYFGDTPVPDEFNEYEDRYRRRFARHTASRAWRHPIRTHRQRQEGKDPKRVYPPTQDLWIWDERSGQAVSTLMRREKKQLYPRSNAVRIAAATARMIAPAHRHYRHLQTTSFASTLAMQNRIGMTIHPRPATWEREWAWLQKLGTCPLLIRFYHHETEQEWNYLIDIIHMLHSAGYPISIAMVQDRRAVLDPARWQAFVAGVLGSLQGVVDWVEVGHTINRVKWGVWTLDEYAALCEPFQAFAGERSPIKLMGPAAIDFEYQYVAGALYRVRDVLSFDALSHHLYVDRRGAPENQQSGFSTVDKAALAKALAVTSPNCSDRLIISEVNWPLLDTGEYSPVGSPYVVPGPRYNNPSVTEDVYGHYMVRYYLQTLCSGHVDQVYWWRLVAHGFGLIDDRSGADWRARPAFAMLQQLLRTIMESRFIQLRTSSTGTFAFEFERTDGERLWIAYAHPDPVHMEIPGSWDRIETADGTVVQPPQWQQIELTSSPLYIRGILPD